MSDHIANRARVIEAIRRELVGPAPEGERIDVTQGVRFSSKEDAYRPYRQHDSGEEILRRGTPFQRYGIGILYPARIETDDPALAGDVEAESEEGLPANSESQKEVILASKAKKDLERLEKSLDELEPSDTEADVDELDLSTANTYKPSTMAISFLATLSDSSEIVVEVTGGRYEKIPVSFPERELHWWKRIPVEILAEFTAASLSQTGECSVRPNVQERDGVGDLELAIEIFSRPHTGNQRLLTVALMNRSDGKTSADERCLFQTDLKVQVIDSTGRAGILPYPGPEFTRLDEEEQSLALLYRDTPNYAIGHGCAADWDPPSPTGLVTRIHAQCLPQFETPSITPEITREDGTSIEVSMADLAGLIDGRNGFDTLEEIITRYKDWINAQSERVDGLDSKFHPAAKRHLSQCEDVAERMRAGLELLKRDPEIHLAFQLANHAMLLQQLHARREARRIDHNREMQRIEFSPPFEDPDPLRETPGRGKWRPFQVAFLLAALASTANGDDSARKTVELIWFPTGGGKTEAYLGLAAFSIFLRRLRNPSDSGVQVLMRYTLRLLTTQQFQRAASLLCAMEHLRRDREDQLGETEFSIGIWVGGGVTPNKRTKAREDFKKLERGSSDSSNTFLLIQCPWCGAQMGRVTPRSESSRKSRSEVFGYELRNNSVALVCPDSQHCEFRNGLPVYVIDEDIYDRRPDFIIGTVDKFAQLAWEPKARSIFGLDTEGDRVVSPPGLILQDELHLISGPLGSMVGLYEGVIEELCTDRRTDPPCPPKIVSSTATIRRYVEQIRALYAREQVCLFPPSGLDAGDSFFATYARHNDGTPRAGRVYLGVYATGLGSLQEAQVRTFASILQAPMTLSSKEEQDPWWTMMAFFNSLRELGTTLSLLQSNIPDYLRVIQNRCDLSNNQVRRLDNIKELTGRMKSDEVPEAIAALEAPTTSSQARPVDVCLASNIIEVGVDIDRLSLLTVVGQPKSTSQYIQVTGRVGRRWWERPGLVVTIYATSRSRDRSHFEQFRNYHERLYAQVEPTSVTPFSPPALERALHAAIVSFVRQGGDQNIADSPYPYPASLVSSIQKILENRVAQVDPDETESFRAAFAKRTKEWRDWQPETWDNGDEDTRLLRGQGDYATASASKSSWATPRSMRNVDAECRIGIVLPSSDEQETGDA